MKPADSQEPPTHPVAGGAEAVDTPAVASGAGASGACRSSGRLIFAQSVNLFVVTSRPI